VIIVVTLHTPFTEDPRVVAVVVTIARRVHNNTIDFVVLHQPSLSRSA